jgi:NAD(P)-dependent dehydrogenase (short-subunit alcohol dehydrogenase family)
MESSMNTLEEKVAWVTGSSRGTGASIAQLFASEGARVAVHGGDEAALAVIRVGIERAGGKAMAVTANHQRDFPHHQERAARPPRPASSS